jgi:hypothetical protein
MTFKAVIDKNDLLNSTFENMATGEKIKGSWMIVAQYLFDRYLELAFCNIIQFVCSVMLFVFVLYHSYLLYYNSTTSESAKVSEFTSYYSKKLELIKWIEKNIEEVKEYFTAKELEVYGIDKSKIDDKNYTNKLKDTAEKYLTKMKNWPYSRQKLFKTLYDVFIRADES